MLHSCIVFGRAELWESQVSGFEQEIGEVIIRDSTTS
jgi:hypothetical protein